MQDVGTNAGDLDDDEGGLVCSTQPLPIQYSPVSLCIISSPIGNEQSSRLYNIHKFIKPQVPFCSSFLTRDFFMLTLV